MKHNRKSCLFLLIITLSPLALFFLYIFISSFFTKTKTYYLAEVDMYIKTIWKPRDKYGYILFGDESSIILSDSIDYILAYPKITNGIFIKLNNDTIWVNNSIELNVRSESNNLEYEYIETNRPQKINSRKYVIIDKVNKIEPLLFDKNNIHGLSFIKEPYIEISIDEYFNGIWIKNAGSSAYTKIEPLD